MLFLCNFVVPAPGQRSCDPESCDPNRVSRLAPTRHSTASGQGRDKRGLRRSEVPQFPISGCHMCLGQLISCKHIYEQQLMSFRQAYML